MPGAGTWSHGWGEGGGEGVQEAVNINLHNKQVKKIICMPKRYGDTVRENRKNIFTEEINCMYM